MIRYSKSSQLSVVYWWGGVNREILPHAAQYGIFCGGMYWAQSTWDVEFYTRSSSFHETLKGILSFLVLLLVFRLNQSMSRHFRAVDLVTTLFQQLERITTDFCANLNGTLPETVEDGKLPPTERKWRAEGLAIAAKVNLIRLVTAFAVSVQMHFQLLDAAADSCGEIEDGVLMQVIFLYTRLQ